MKGGLQRCTNVPITQRSAPKHTSSRNGYPGPKRQAQSVHSRRIHRNPLNGPQGSKTNRWINKVCHMHATDMLTARERRALLLCDHLAGPHKHQVNGESQTHKSHRGIPQVWDRSRLRRIRRGASGNMCVPAVVTRACPLHDNSSGTAREIQASLSTRARCQPDRLI